MSMGGFNDGMTLTVMMITIFVVWLNFISFLRSTFISFATFVGGGFEGNCRLDPIHCDFYSDFDGIWRNVCSNYDEKKGRMQC